jgi:DNA-binding LacI/PurR family transcriptional regulator
MTVQRSLKRATISDVARMAGVSISTVSRVLNGTAPVAEETVQQVNHAILTLDYAPHAAARTLAGRRTDTIGLLLPEISGAFYSPLIHGIESGAREAGFDLLIHTSADEFREHGRIQMPLDEHNTDGLLVFTNRLTDAELARFYGRGFPLVLLYRSAPAALDIPVVTLENKAGARSLVEHLIVAHGRRRIAFLAGPAGNEDSCWREAGYLEALRAHGIEDDPALHEVGAFDDKQGQAATERLLRQGAPFDAVFAGDDEAAMGCIQALTQAGTRVPEDVAVVGFDDVLFAHLMTPKLTTVRAPIETAGRQAAHMLISLIQGDEVERLVLLPTELVIRQSCGCA